jgi:hypothetical protein
MYDASVWGERRSDVRAAVNTANIIASQASNMTDEEFRRIVGAIASYMPGENDDDDGFFDHRAVELIRQRVKNECPSET